MRGGMKSVIVDVAVSRRRSLQSYLQKGAQLVAGSANKIN